MQSSRNVDFSKVCAAILPRQTFLTFELEEDDAPVFSSVHGRRLSMPALTYSKVVDLEDCSTEEDDAKTVSDDSNVRRSFESCTLNMSSKSNRASRRLAERKKIRQQNVVSVSKRVEDTHDASEDLNTTLILKSIPSKCSHDELVSNLDDAGFGGLYNFVYIPMRIPSGVNFGYALINFVDHESACQGLGFFQNYTKWADDTDSTAATSAEWTNHQGLDAHVERVRNSRVMHKSVSDEFKPRLFVAGVQVEFPKPTIRMAAPHADKGFSKAN